jgi:hypothetical protein
MLIFPGAGQGSSAARKQRTPLPERIHDARLWPRTPRAAFKRAGREKLESHADGEAIWFADCTRSGAAGKQWVEQPVTAFLMALVTRRAHLPFRALPG